MNSLNIIAVLTIIISISGVLRILWYRRGQAQYRPIISFIASLMLASLLYSAFHALIKHSEVTWWQAIIPIVITISLYRVRGNVAALFRLPTLQKH